MTELENCIEVKMRYEESYFDDIQIAYINAKKSLSFVIKFHNFPFKNYHI